MHQIDETQEARYEESEIVSSVIRAMIPNVTLRNVLESTPNLKPPITQPDSSIPGSTF